MVLLLEMVGAVSLRRDGAAHEPWERGEGVAAGPRASPGQGGPGSTGAPLGSGSIRALMRVPMMMLVAAEDLASQRPSPCLGPAPPPD